MLSIHQKLQHVQSKLNAPKGQYNTFGKYKYRSLEDINEALKPLLAEVGAWVTVTDTPVCVDGRFYIKALATFSDGQGAIVATAYAREEEQKKGMDGAQVTGSASSYARKYAMNGLFLIDDTKDPDATNKGANGFISEKQQSTLLEYLDEMQENKAKFFGFFGADDVSKIPANRYQEALKMIEARRSQKEAS